MNRINFKDSVARAHIEGSSRYPDLHGTVTFQQLKRGVLISAEVHGLPGDGASRFFGFHIHGGNSCTGNNEDAFADAGMHYNPTESEHPYHAGDLPPLLSVNGFAYMTVLTGRFTVKEIIGKTVVVHSGVDDFTTQPAGNAGTKIACGVIYAL